MSDLTNNTPDNVHFMIEAVKTKLRMASGAALKASELTDEQYEDLRDIYALVSSKSTFSVMEIDAITTELGRLRK